ncbi:hypothetical protein QOZ80_4AG0305530 [Eleusine coracana subsp. coracana]|nr:hypothetical protein QOZ80_4AG0305530 [Eleusine coracana subsp. coracana]
MEGPHLHGEREASPEERESKEVRMLREMILQARREEEEPQVPDEQLRANYQLQQDEILALEAIYGESIGIFDENGELRSFQIDVHFEIPDGISVSAELFQGVDGDIESQIHAFVIQHLPPISLTCVMPADSTMGAVDVRAVVEITSLESVVHWLISYNEEQCHESFRNGLHDCMICLSEYAGIDFIKLPCLHYYCWRCMESYTSMHVKEGTVQKLSCPYDKCKGVIPPNLLKRLLGDADFERWERLTLQKTLDSMVDVTYCPRCQTACLEDEENNAQCSKCFFSFCTRCRERRHIGGRCMTPEEKLLSLQVLYEAIMLCTYALRKI